MQKKSIGEIFVSTGLVTEEQLSQAVENGRQLGVGRKIGDVLVSMGLVTERDKAKCMGIQWGVQYVDLTDYPIQEEAIKCI